MNLRSIVCSDLSILLRNVVVEDLRNAERFLLLGIVVIFGVGLGNSFWKIPPYKVGGQN